MKDTHKNPTIWFANAFLSTSLVPKGAVEVGESIPPVSTLIPTKA